MNLLVGRAAHVSSTDGVIGYIEEAFSYELSETLMGVAESAQPTPILRRMNTASLVVPPDLVHDLLGELIALRAQTIGTTANAVNDDARLARHFDALIAFVREAVAASEYVLMSAAVIPTTFWLADPGETS